MIYQFFTKHKFSTTTILQKMLFILLIINSMNFSVVHSQIENRYWLVFDDRCENDNLDIINLSICESYLEELHQMGFYEKTTSRWLNAVTVNIKSTSDLNKLSSLPYIKEIKPVNRNWKLASNTYKDVKRSSYALIQINPDTLYNSSLNGNGVKIGIIDAGFWKSNTNDYLKTIFEEDRVQGFKDYVAGVETSENIFFNSKRTGSDSHGTSVFRMIGGKDNHMRYGLADKATYFLARTDNGDTENRSEEENWIAALEWMVDSLDIHLINSSLGYSIGFDDPKENYSPEDMDGKTSMVTRAAEIAAEEKNVLLVVSAGNEGDNNKWKVVSAPADARGVLSIGATTKTGTKASYSSIGPEQLNYVKPEVSCFSLFGTSFSAPVITGLAACLWQYKPSATAAEIRGAIIQSSWFYPYANNYIGYGVPDAAKAIHILGDEVSKSSVSEIMAYDEKKIKVKEGNNEGTLLIAYHKESETIVIKQEFIYLKEGTWLVKKPKKAISTTLWTGKRHIEVFWKK
ncbi:peptidase S8 [Flammeovirga pectinis]|uniref:Peptidase S8 n=2 Tax=Flammeovirga pectinis TaxID=2494373 RepID=A0A3S9P552_9BACT|nr:peptidase S8 [Flammeovirga pectinis]